MWASCVVVGWMPGWLNAIGEPTSALQHMTVYEAGRVQSVHVPRIGRGCSNMLHQQHTQFLQGHTPQRGGL